MSYFDDDRSTQTYTGDGNLLVRYCAPVVGGTAGGFIGVLYGAEKSAARRMELLKQVSRDLQGCYPIQRGEGIVHWLLPDLTDLYANVSYVRERGANLAGDVFKCLGGKVGGTVGNTLGDVFRCGFDWDCVSRELSQGGEVISQIAQSPEHVQQLLNSMTNLTDVYKNAALYGLLGVAITLIALGAGAGIGYLTSRYRTS